MPITFVGAGALGANATLASQSISSDANTQVGDILICQLLNRSAISNVMSPPDGTWTQIFQFQNSVVLRCAAFWKVATSAGAQSFTFTKASDDNVLFGGVISSWRGVDQSSPIDATSPVVQGVGSVADNVTFGAFNPTSSSPHVIFFAYYGDDQTTFSAAMSNDVNPDCTTRYDVETNLGVDGSWACTSGDNDGSNIASRTWASNSSSDGISVGAVFALVPEVGGSRPQFQRPRTPWLRPLRG